MPVNADLDLEATVAVEVWASTWTPCSRMHLANFWTASACATFSAGVSFASAAAAGLYFLQARDADSSRCRLVSDPFSAPLTPMR